MAAAAAGALLAETRRRPGRLLLTGLAITVATVFAAGTLLLGETLRVYLGAENVKTPDTVAAVVMPAKVPEDVRGALVGQVSAVDGVAQAVGVLEFYPSVGSAGAATTWRVLSDPMTGSLTRLTGPPVQGTLPVGPDQVAVGVTTAERTGLVPGDKVTMRASEGAAPRTVSVTAVVPLPDGGLNSLVATPDGVAASGGFLEQVDVAAAPGVDPAALSARISANLGVPDAALTGTAQRAIELAEGSAEVSSVLIGVGVFAGLAVVAAVVIVASTFRIVLTQRRTQMALLRCVGARRGQVVRAVLAEAVVTGLVAGVLGVVVALVAGYGLLAAAVASGMQDVPDLVVPWPGLAGVLVMAVLATVLAAVAPALAASRIPPVAALGAADASDAGTPRAGRRIAVAVVLAVIAGGLAALALGIGSTSDVLAVMVVAVSGLVAFAALIVIGPVMVRGMVALAGRPIAAIGGAAGRLALANAAQVPRRTAATISVLALGVGLTSALLVGVSSVRMDAEQSIAEQFPTDLVVGTADGESAAALAARLATDPRLTVRADGVTVFVDPAPGVAEDVARDAVEQGVSGLPAAMVQYAGDAREQVESTLGTAQLIGLGLVGMTALVAVVGVGVTLTLSVTERTRETGLLRAVGLSRHGVRSMVAWEAALSGAGAAVIGAVLGAVYGALGMQVLGFAKALSLPILTLVGLVAGVVAVAALAAMAPAVRAGRVQPIRALQEA